MQNNKKFYINYLNKIINLYPQLTSGRKNYLEHRKRILKNFKLIINFKKNE